MEPRRIYDHRSTHYQPHRTAASDPGYRSLRAFLLVKRQGAMDHLRKSRPHETHARERSRDRRERSHVPHSARPISLFRIGQSQAEKPTNKAGATAAEPVEPRAGTERNADEQSTHRTLSRARVTQALGRVRQFDAVSYSR